MNVHLYDSDVDYEDSLLLPDELFAKQFLENEDIGGWFWDELYQKHYEDVIQFFVDRGYAFDHAKEIFYTLG